MYSSNLHLLIWQRLLSEATCKWGTSQAAADQGEAFVTAGSIFIHFTLNSSRIFHFYLNYYISIATCHLFFLLFFKWSRAVHVFIWVTPELLFRLCLICSIYICNCKRLIQRSFLRLWPSSKSDAGEQTALKCDEMSWFDCLRHVSTLVLILPLL